MPIKRQLPDTKYSLQSHRENRHQHSNLCRTLRYSVQTTIRKPPPILLKSKIPESNRTFKVCMDPQRAKYQLQYHMENPVQSANLLNDNKKMQPLHHGEILHYLPTTDGKPKQKIRTNECMQACRKTKTAPELTAWRENMLSASPYARYQCALRYARSFTHAHLRTRTALGTMQNKKSVSFSDERRKPRNKQPGNKLVRIYIK